VQLVKYYDQVVESYRRERRRWKNYEV